MKISDFKLAEFFLRQICDHYQCGFVDLEIEFGEKESYIEDNRMFIGPTDKFSRTVFQIISTYLQNINSICGKDLNISDENKISIYNTLIAMIRDLTYSPDGFTYKNAIQLHLNRMHFTWVVMQSIICPAYNKPLQNFRIIAAKSPYVDGAKFYQEADIATTSNVSQNDFPFIFVNLDIENVACRNAFLLKEAIRAHGLDPEKVIFDLLTKSEMKNKLLGAAKIVFVETDIINNFVALLASMIGYNETESMMVMEKNSKWNSKIGLYSQAQYNASTWWLLGLIEKMLGPARQPDWTAYQNMKPFTDELWEKVEKVKKERGLDPLPMEALLRVQSEDFKQKPNLIIQGLLADNRVW